jgi:hypothetical protein
MTEEKKPQQEPDAVGSELSARLGLVKAGANAKGLILIGDAFIGYRFSPRNELAEFADSLLDPLVEEDPQNFSAWCHAHRDADYSHQAWTATA